MKLKFVAAQSYVVGPFFFFGSYPILMVKRSTKPTITSVRPKRKYALCGRAPWIHTSVLWGHDEPIEAIPNFKWDQISLLASLFFSKYQEFNYDQKQPKVNSV